MPACIWRHPTAGELEPKDFPGRNYSSARDINDSGQVVGWSGAVNGDRAFLWTPATHNGTVGVMLDLGDLPGGNDYSTAWAINASGQVVGNSTDISGSRAFVWEADDGMRDLNMLLDASGAGWTLLDAFDINEIVGYGEYDPDGPGGVPWVSHGFLLTPVPEPSGLALALIGSYVGRRCRRV